MRIYSLILGRETTLITENAEDLFERNIKGDKFIGEPYAPWKRVQVWENGKIIKHITISGNAHVDMPQNDIEVWEQMIN